MSRHYIPVAAKRRALEIYRGRRQTGGGPFHPGPMVPIDAIQATVDFFAGHLAFAVAYDDTKRMQDLLDGYRAAHYYRQRMYKKPWRNQIRRPAKP